MSAIRQSIATREWQQCRRVRTGQVETRLGNRKNLKWYLGLSAQRKGQNCCGTCLLGGRLSLPVFGQKVAGTRNFARNYILIYQLYRLGGGDGEIRTLGAEFSARRFSKPLVSATHPRLRIAAARWAYSGADGRRQGLARCAAQLPGQLAWPQFRLASSRRHCRFGKVRLS